MDQHIPNKTLNNGILIPEIGFGTSLINGQECIEVVKNAINVGYRHIDTASAYENENEIGIAIHDCNVPRSELFITSKVWKNSMGYNNTIKSFNSTLKKLNIDYVDLFLIHWPNNTNNRINIETWRALERMYSEGKVKSIGVSNFLAKHIKMILDYCNVIPAVNQIEFHPGLIREKTIQLCKEHNIIIEAWSPLGKGKVLENLTLNKIAKKYNKTVAQICLRWCIQNKVIPLPKTCNKDRMKQNINIYDFELSEEDILEINNLQFFAGSNMDPYSFN